MIRIVKILLVIFYQQGFSQNWLPLNNGLGCDISGPQSNVREMFVDTVEGKIYFCGNLFYTENGEYESCESTTAGVAAWNGTRFISLTGGYDFQQGFHITKFKNSLYASAPIFVSGSTLNCFSPWNGYGWNLLEGEPNSRVLTSKIIDNELWLGGGFDMAGGAYSQMLCKFDGTNFSSLDLGEVEYPNFISSMDFLKDTLYLAGSYIDFTAEGDTISAFAKYYNNELHKIKPRFTNYSGINYNCLVNYKDELYLGGYMVFAGEDTVRRLLKYDGNKFSEVGPPNMRINQQPTRLRVYNNELYILGIFSQLGDQPAQGLIKWNGEKYTILNTDTFFSKYGVPNTALSVSDFDILNDTLYVAGDFYTIGNDTMRCIAKLNRALSDPIPPPAENSLTLYPNPSSDEVTIGYTLNSLQNVSFGIYDIRGRLIKKIEKGKKDAGQYVLEKVDISALANGIYIVQMLADKQKISKKLFKE